MNLEFLTTRSIYENPNISQRDIAKDFVVSLGKINSVIKIAEDKGYLTQNAKNTSYKITDKGREFVESYKVDAAVILACGMGIRLAPLTYDTPKSFIKINGERMIERQIEQLREVGIKDITIMVGYLKEKFDYLIDKYGVKLIYNEEYKEKNTLSTLYHAKDVIKNKNIYVCVSDVYISKNIFHKYECEPYYVGAFYDDCSNEWRYIVNSKNEIKAVELGGKNDYCLVGPCFLTKEFSNKLLPLIEENYKKPATEKYYWEDVLVTNFENLPPMYLHKFDRDVIYEFDTLDDIKKFDVKNEGYGSEAISFVSRALDIEENQIENIECIKEGMTNHSYKFSYKDDTYFARIPGEGTDKFIDRKSEAEVINSLRDKNITEDVIYFDKNTGYKISKYIQDAKPVDVNSESDLKRCMALYRKFHSFGIEVSATCDIIYKINEYLDLISKKNVMIPYEDFDEVISKAKKIERDIEKLDRPKTLCHGDPNPNNVLISSDDIRMIDFEYAGMADPLSDISLFGAYINFDTEKTYNLYKMYKEASDENADYLPSDDKIAKRIIISYMALGGLYNALWAMVRSSLGGADYGTFGMTGYRVFKNCYSKL